MFECIAERLNLDKIYVDSRKARVRAFHFTCTPLNRSQILKCLEGDFYQSRLTTAPD